jgi:hypothetical protein
MEGLTEVFINSIFDLLIRESTPFERERIVLICNEIAELCKEKYEIMPVEAAAILLHMGMQLLRSTDIE